MKISKAMVAVVVLLVALVGVVGVMVLYESPRVSEWRRKAALLDARCRSVRTRVEVERGDLENPEFRSRAVQRMRDELPSWRSHDIDMCTRHPVDLSGRGGCVVRGDTACLIALDRAVEAAIPPWRKD